MSSDATQSPPQSSAEPTPESSNPSHGSNPTPETGTSDSSPSTFDTQPLCSQEVPEVNNQAWGQLNVIGANISYDLVKDSYHIGRGEQCDVILKDKLPPTKATSLWKSCSKQHFKIYAETKSTGRFIFIQDLSSNGTLVNRELVGKGRFTVLKQGDVISLVKKDWRAFMYMDLGSKDEDDETPDEVKQKYMFVKDLGRGACGTVKLAIGREDKARVACKCIDKKSVNFAPTNKDLMKEVRIVTQLNHPCVIKVSEVIDTEQTLYIFMELVEAGDLFELIKTTVRLEPECTKYIMYQICLAIKHLHDNNIVHRDLKPENIMLTSIVPENMIVKVTDFGLSSIMETSSLLQSLCGTPFYVAPEMVATSGMGSGYTKAVDCWSLGVILYVWNKGCYIFSLYRPTPKENQDYRLGGLVRGSDLQTCPNCNACAVCHITGQPAFTHQRQDMELRDQILQGNYTMKEKYWEHLPDAKDLVHKLLTVDPEQRYTIDQVLDHIWFKDEPMLQRVTKLLEDERASELPGALNNLPDSVLNTPEPKRRKLMDTKEYDRSDAATPLLRTDSAHSSTTSPMSEGTSVSMNCLPPSVVMDTESEAASVDS